MGVLLALGLAGAVPPVLAENSDVPSLVTGLRTAGPDLEVFLSTPLEGDAAVVLLDAAGVQVASAPVSVEDGAVHALLAGALAAVPAHGPAYRLIVATDEEGSLGEPFPFLVALRCLPESPCRFQLLPGLEAPGAALVEPALSSALDDLPAGAPDLLAAAASDPALRGAALTAAWTWPALGKVAPGTCSCFWTLEAALPGDTLDGGAGVGVLARGAQGEEVVRIERARVSSLALRQRCVLAGLGPAQTVTVADGDWSTSLEVPRVVLAACAEACAPAVSWETDMGGWARATAEGGADSAARASWQTELAVDGAVALHLEDEVVSAAGVEGGEAERRASWAGEGGAVTLRASARAEIAAPGGPTDADAIGAASWLLAGQGVSACALPARVEVSLSSQARLGPGTPVTCHPDHYDPGQIGLLISDGRLCPPGWKR
jgi:hypothetical protein